MGTNCIPDPVQAWGVRRSMATKTNVALSATVCVEPQVSLARHTVNGQIKKTPQILLRVMKIKNPKQNMCG